MREYLARRWRILRQTWWIPLLFISPLVLYPAIFVVNWPEWTGFNSYKTEEQTSHYKTLWDWMSLLIVPLAIALAGYAFNRIEKQAENARAEKHAETERQIAADNQQQEALQVYFDRMADLLLDKDTPLRGSKPQGEVRAVARARTLAVLRGLNAERKGSVLRFLYESNLIIREEKYTSIVSLSGADLQGANLERAFLEKANLYGANLQAANLKMVSLYGAFLQEADLQEADLQGAFLHGSDFQEANLQGANLFGTFLLGANLAQAKLQGANLAQADLQKVNLQGARYTSKTTWPDGFDDATLEERGAIKENSL